MSSRSNDIEDLLFKCSSLTFLPVKSIKRAWNIAFHKMFKIKIVFFDFSTHWDKLSSGQVKKRFSKCWEKEPQWQLKLNSNPSYQKTVEFPVGCLAGNRIFAEKWFEHETKKSKQINHCHWDYLSSQGQLFEILWNSMEVFKSYLIQKWFCNDCHHSWKESVKVIEIH